VGEAPVAIAVLGRRARSTTAGRDCSSADFSPPNERTEIRATAGGGFRDLYVHSLCERQANTSRGHFQQQILATGRLA
jgi:hypothetical protein